MYDVDFVKKLNKFRLSQLIQFGVREEAVKELATEVCKLLFVVEEEEEEEEEE